MEHAENKKKNNNEIIINKFGSLQDLILLFKIPTAMQNSFFEICRKFGHAPAKRFASPGLFYMKLLQLQQQSISRPDLFLRRGCFYGFATFCWLQCTHTLIWECVYSLMFINVMLFIIHNIFF